MSVLRVSGLSTQQARQDTTALLIAKWIELNTGERLAIEQSMEKLLQDPERIGSVCLTLLNLVSQYATSSGKSPQGLKALVDFLIDQLERTAPK